MKAVNVPPRPFVLLNMAMTADGKIATSTHSVHTFGSPADSAHFYRLRATADAILCGARTVEETGATLGNGGERFLRARRRRGLSDHPLRIVVSGAGTLASDAGLWRHRFSPIVVLTSRRAPAREIRRLEGLADTVWISPGRELDFPAALAWVRSQFGVTRLLCEGGAGVNDALFRARLVDELHVTLCPLIFGGRTAPGLSEGIGFARMDAAAGFRLRSVRRRGDEFFLVYQMAVIP